MLRLQSGNGSFGGTFDEGTMGGVWVLAYLRGILPHRRDEIGAALQRSAHGPMRLCNVAPGPLLFQPSCAFLAPATSGESHGSFESSSRSWSMDRWAYRSVCVVRA